MNSEDWNRRYREKQLVWSAGPNQFVVAEISDMKAGRVLDVACGEGRNALWLAEHGWDVTALDYSSVAIEKAQARSSDLGLPVDWRVADATTDIQGDFDLILFIYLHLPRPQTEAALSLAVKALAESGTLLIVGHDLRNIEEGIGGPQDPDILFGPDDLAGMLFPLHIERAETVRREVSKDGRIHQALDVLVRATKSER